MLELPTEGEGEGDGATRPTRRRPGLVPYAILLGGFAVCQVVAAVAGVRFDGTALDGTRATDVWQLLDVRLLRTDLLDSVWHLNSQPPLFNLYCGLVLKLPGGLQRPFEVVTYLVLAVVLVLGTYQVLVELNVPWGAALAVTLICVVASPAYLLYENWLDYAEPTAALGVVAAWCLIRYLRGGRAAFGVGLCTALGAIVLLNSTYQVAWMVVVLAGVLLLCRHRWRQVVAVAVVPLVVVGAWYVKDAVMFGTTTTSSWLGMNLARGVLYRAPQAQIRQMIRQGTLTPLASVPAFSAPATYVPRFVHNTPSTIAAIGSLSKADGRPNFNNPLYIAVSSQYLHDDLAYIRAHPGAYVGEVNDAAQVWLEPTDQNFTASFDWPHVRGYASVYDRVVEWQPTTDPAAAFILFRHTPIPLSWLSIQAILVYLLALVGGPLVAWRLRRRDPVVAGAVALLWWTTLYAFAASSLLEIGENERYRFELGPLPLILAAVVVTTAVRAWRARGSTSGTSSGSVPVPPGVTTPLTEPVHAVPVGPRSGG